MGNNISLTSLLKIEHDPPAIQHTATLLYDRYLYGSILADLQYELAITDISSRHTMVSQKANKGTLLPFLRSISFMAFTDSSILEGNHTSSASQNI